MIHAIRYVRNDNHFVSIEINALYKKSPS